MNDNLEQVAGANSEFEGKIVKPILNEDWALMFSKLRSLLLSDAYKIEDMETRQLELQAVRAMPISFVDIRRSMGRSEIFNAFFWSALKLNKWTQEQMVEWINNLEFDEDKNINRTQDLFNFIIDLSIQKPKGDGIEGVPLAGAESTPS